MAELDQLTVATKRFVRGNASSLIDMLFNEGPFVAYMKNNLREDFTGGHTIYENFIYAGLKGGSYAKGKTFDITQKQIEQAAQFQMKFFEVNVTLYKEDVQVLNQGPAQVFPLIKSRMEAAYMTMGSFLEIAAFMNGVNAGYTTNFNGLAEALNDNATASWDNNTYANYGTIGRATASGLRLRRAPTNVNGPISYPTLEETYSACSFGNREPNVGLTTPLCLSYIKEKFQTQQRFNDTTDPNVGFTGLKFNSATIIKTRYCPGSDIATANSDSNIIAVDYLTESSAGAVLAYPTLAVASSETLFWLNARKPFFNFYVTNDPEFGFGFTGWKPGQGNTTIVGQVLAACAITLAPRYHNQIYGITG